MWTCLQPPDVKEVNGSMVAYDVPLVLPFMCANAREMKQQCHQDSPLLVFIRYKATKKAMDTLSLWETSAIPVQ